MSLIRWFAARCKMVFCAKTATQLLLMSRSDGVNPNLFLALEFTGPPPKGRGARTVGIDQLGARGRSGHIANSPA